MQVTENPYSPIFYAVSGIVTKNSDTNFFTVFSSSYLKKGYYSISGGIALAWKDCF